MRRMMIVLLLLITLAIPVDATQEEQVEDFYQSGEDYGVVADFSLEENIATLWQGVVDEVDDLLNSAARTGVQILAVVILCGVVETSGIGGGGSCSVVTIAGSLAVTALAMGEVGSMIGLGRDTIDGMQTFSNILLPVMATLTAATGNIRLAAVHQGVTVAFAQLLISVIDGLLIPMVYVYLATCCAHAAVGNSGLKRIAELIRRGITTVLTGMLVVFVAYLTVSGAVAGTADSATVRAAKIAMSRAVPVVGGILSDAAESMLVGAGVIRTSVGVVGMLVVLAICLVPFLYLLTHYLTFQVAGALAATVAEPKLSKLIEEIGSAFGLVLGMTATCALLLMFSLVAAVTAVVA